MDFAELVHPLVRTLITAAYFITMLVIIGVIMLENRNPLKTISWIIVLLTIPVLGVILYIFFGQNWRKEKIIARKGLKNHDLFASISHSQVKKLSDSNLLLNTGIYTKRNIIRLLLNNANAIVTHGNRVNILNNGVETFTAIIAEMEKARSFIHLQYYIFDDDIIGNRIIETLKKKAEQGVEVRVIIDDVGGWQLKNSFYKKLKESGIMVERFLKVRFPMFTSKVHYRNHRKIVIVDGKVGFLGGINIADRYLYGMKNYGVWRDMHLRIEGDAVLAMQEIFLTDWYFVKQEELTDQKYFPAIPPAGEKLVQIVPSGPDSDWPAIMMGYLQSIASAMKYVYIATPYFMPNEPVLMAIKAAALGGIDVRLMIPEKSDAEFTHLCSRSYIKELLLAGVKVYFYEKGFLHSKLLVVDDLVLSIGTANMDFRSFEHNFEVNAFIYDREKASEARNIYLDDLNDCRQIYYDIWAGRSRWMKIKESFARLFSPLL
ncbi:MAG: cardiolipin synthase [Chlorobi bacterium]|nr:cardiolipin synthase [Chlorobiota bacterium]